MNFLFATSLDGKGDQREPSFIVELDLYASLHGPETAMSKPTSTFAGNLRRPFAVC